MVMKRLSLSEFTARYVRRASTVEFSKVYHRDLHVDADALVSGIVEGSLYVHGDTHVLLTGIVHGRVHVDRAAVLWVDGAVEGAVMVEGAAFINGRCGSVKLTHPDAAVHDPSEPADRQTVCP